MKTARNATPVLLCGFLALCFAAGAFVPPALEAAGLAGGPALRSAYGSLCHQIPSRSLRVWGRPLAICARCSGLYAGGTLGLFLAALATGGRGAARPRFLLVACAPIALDAVARLLGWPGLPNVPRLVTAVPAGVIGGLLLAHGIADLAVQARQSAMRSWAGRLPVRPTLGAGVKR